MVFDASELVIDYASFECKDWASSDFGHILSKEKLMPPNILQPRGLGFITIRKVDANDVADTVTRRLRNGFIVYLNCALISWFSKK